MIMVKCPECGFENPEGSAYCAECGNEIKIASRKPVKKMDNLWYLVTFLIPLVGILGGLYYWAKGYKNANKVLYFGLFMAIVNTILISWSYL
jgi:predicted nucleic acid-binding Zn ribbon protein